MMQVLPDSFAAARIAFPRIAAAAHPANIVRPRQTVP
jgi:hypothetical protein